MKLKTIFKLIIALVSVVALASCLETVDHSVPKTHTYELSLLNEYIDSLHHRGLDVDTTALGVYYVVDSEGNGPYPVTGDTCVIKYKGFLLDGGYYFDDSSLYNKTDSTFQFVLGVGDYIPGWTDGMKVINEGSLVYLIIPSNLAYGGEGNNYNIGPYETLIFQVDMVDIKQAY